MERHYNRTLPQKSKRGGVARKLHNSARRLLDLYRASSRGNTHHCAGKHYRNDANDYHYLDERKACTFHDSSFPD